jgi:hypothetical protein
VQGVQIAGEQVINTTSSPIGKPDAFRRIENGVWSLSGRSQIHHGQAAYISVKLGANRIKARHSAMTQARQGSAYSDRFGSAENRQTNSG